MKLNKVKGKQIENTSILYSLHPGYPLEYKYVNGTIVHKRTNQVLMFKGVGNLSEFVYVSKVSYYNVTCKLKDILL